MKISLVLCTLNRVLEPERFLDSLVRQSYHNFEVILVDQNEDNRLEPIITRYRSLMDIRWLKTGKGLSKGRNVALNHVSGDIVAFPDDDCEYYSYVLENVTKILSQPEIDGICGRSVGVLPPAEVHTHKRSTVKLNWYNVWIYGISYVIFLKRHVVDKTGEFDERLGVGSGTVYGSGEETDYLVRALKLGANLCYDPSVIVYHPLPNFSDPNIVQKAYSYSVGRRFVLEKHNYPRIFIMANQVYPLIKMLVHVKDPRKRQYFWNQFKGRMVT